MYIMEPYIPMQNQKIIKFIKIKTHFYKHVFKKYIGFNLEQADVLD